MISVALYEWMLDNRLTDQEEAWGSTDVVIHVDHEKTID